MFQHMHALSASAGTDVRPTFLQPVRGSGPWGLPLPGEVRGAVAELQRSMAPLMPRLRAIAVLPGAQQARADLLRGLQARPHGSPNSIRRVLIIVTVSA